MSSWSRNVAPTRMPGRIVDPAHERQPGPAALEPVVAAAVDLDEQPGLGHPVAPAAVPGRPAVPRARDPLGPQDPADGDPAEHDPLALGEQLGEVRVVDARIGGPGQGQDPRPGRLVDPPPESRPRLPWTRAAGPSAGMRARRRQTERSESPRKTAASCTVSSSHSTLVSTQARRWSLVVIVIVSRIRGD